MFNANYEGERTGGSTTTKDVVYSNVPDLKWDESIYKGSFEDTHTKNEFDGNKDLDQSAFYVFFPN